MICNQISSFHKMFIYPQKCSFFHVHQHIIYFNRDKNQTRMTNRRRVGKKARRAEEQQNRESRQCGCTSIVRYFLMLYLVFSLPGLLPMQQRCCLDPGTTLSKIKNLYLCQALAVATNIINLFVNRKETPEMFLLIP